MARSEIIDAALGQRIKQLREKLGLSVSDVAAALDLKPFALREIEAGRNVRQYIRIAELARLLGTTPNYILGTDPDMPVPTDPLDMMGAAVQVMLIDEGWPRERAEALVDIATEVAIEKGELDLDRRLAAAFRKRALRRQT